MKFQEFVQKQKVLVRDMAWDMWEIKYYVRRWPKTTHPHIVTNEPLNVIFNHGGTEEERKCSWYSYCIEGTDIRCSGKSLIDRIFFSKDSPSGEREIEGIGDIVLEKKRIDNEFWIVESKITDFGIHEIARHNLKHIESYYLATIICSRHEILNFGNEAKKI